MNSFAIKAEGIGKLYRLEHGGGASTFREMLTDVVQAPLRRFRRLSGTDRSMEDFWALQDVSFEVQPGEVVGIVGRNGAGKSTLLKILSRIVEPTRGQAVLRGRVASLLEVGTGFHPELTGRENIFLNGSILGMKKREIQRKFDEIVAFAEIDKFLDTPVKRYSSGMYVRLAFAVAAHLQPEILIVDEVLAVGDAEFQKKCLGKMREVSVGDGRTVLFVSHNMSAVTALCTRAFLLEKGGMVAEGSPAQVIEKYLVPASMESSGIFDLRQTISRAENFHPLVYEVRVLDDSGRPTSSAVPRQKLRMEIDLQLEGSMRTPMIDIGFNSARGERIFMVSSNLSPTPLGKIDNSGTVSVEFELPALYPGKYEFDVGLMPLSGRYVDHIAPAGAIDILHDTYLQCSYPYFNEMGAVLVRSRWCNVV